MTRVQGHQVDGVVKSLIAGTGTTVDNTDPENPIVSATVVPDTTSLVPLVTSLAGTPDLVWDDNDELVLTEVTL